MQYYLRFECYNDPSRESFTALRLDIPIDGPVHFDYGSPLQVSNDENDPATWPLYYVANLTLMEKIDDPAEPGKGAFLLHVYLARAAQWPEFELPQTLKELRDEDQNEL